MGTNSKWYVEKPCEHCGKVFLARRHEPWGEPHRFCSRPCWLESKSRFWTKRKCEQCQKEFRLPPSSLKRSGGGRFCSRQCKLEHWRLHGKDHPRNGAPHRHVSGYVYEYAPEHHSVQGKAYKRVLQHRLVMERILGRMLRPWENVHHKDGVRSNNAEDNLELWVVNQPPGQTAEYLRELVEARRRILELEAMLKSI